MTIEARSSGQQAAGCFATDVVRAGLDPLTGRTLSFNHVPMATWAGHLCDLLVAGRVVDAGGNAVTTDHTPPMHPLVERAWAQLRPSLPRPWRLLFGPQVVDISRVTAETRDWLVDAGVWTRRRTLLGNRYRAADPRLSVVRDDPGTRSMTPDTESGDVGPLRHAGDVSDHDPCGCEPDLGTATYARECDYCGRTSAGVHCVHDQRQDPCPECDVLPVSQLPSSQ